MTFSQSIEMNLRFDCTSQNISSLTELKINSATRLSNEMRMSRNLLKLKIQTEKLTAVSLKDLL